MRKRSSRRTPSGLPIAWFSRDDHDVDIASDGTFDVVLCLGILYHLDVPDVFTLIDQMAAMCTRTLIVDTHITFEPTRTESHQGYGYRGADYIEHDEDSSSREERQHALWASLDNPKSFWPTRSSLLTLLAHAGFTTVAEVHVPAWPGQKSSRRRIHHVEGRAPSSSRSRPFPLMHLTSFPEVPIKTVTFSQLGGRSRFAQYRYEPFLRSVRRRPRG